jgi:hypothetical protein
MTKDARRQGNVLPEGPTGEEVNVAILTLSAFNESNPPFMHAARPMVGWNGRGNAALLVFART